MATESELRKSVATFLDSYIGIKEGSTEHKKLLSIFNDSGLCTRYKMTTSDAWCACSVSCAFIATGLTSIFPCVECSCAQMITLAKKAGIWVESDSYTPSVGDVLLYDWDDSGSGDNTGNPDHVGIVYSVSGTSLKIIEGNKSDTVGYRSMTVNGKYIRGYITPKYSSVATSSSSSSSSSSSKTESATTTTTSTNFKAKDKVTLNKVKLYKNATTTTASGTKTGTFYIWDAEVTNGRIRITTTTANCGKSGQVTGWVNESDITSTSSSSSSSSSGAPSKTVKWTGKVTTNGGTLNVRKGPGTDYDKLTSYPSLKNGTTVSVCDTVTGTDKKSWYYICYNGKYGYVSASYITKVS